MVNEYTINMVNCPKQSFSLIQNPSIIKKK